MVFCYKNCSDPQWEKIDLVIEKNFWNVRLKAEIFSNFLRSLEQFVQTMKGQNNIWWQNAFLTCFWRFLISNKLEQLEFKLEKIIGIQKHAGKVRKYILPANYSRSIWKFSHSITKRHLFRLARVSTSFGLSKLVVRPGLVR